MTSRRPPRKVSGVQPESRRSTSHHLSFLLSQIVPQRWYLAAPFGRPLNRAATCTFPPFPRQGVYRAFSRDGGCFGPFPRFHPGTQEAPHSRKRNEGPHVATGAASESHWQGEAARRVEGAPCTRPPSVQSRPGRTQQTQLDLPASSHPAVSMETMPRSLEERFWEKVDRRGDDECWLWMASTRNGYGQIGIWKENRVAYAHRLAYEWLVGPIPEGLQLDHLCRVRHCVNPAHLEPVTIGQNLKRGEGFAGVLYKPKTHCKRGHPLSGDNIYTEPGGKRVCLTCRREWDKRRYWRAKSA